MLQTFKGYIIAFLSGALIVAISVLVFVLKTAKPVINADQYINQLEQTIGKIKGNGNVTTPTITTETKDNTPVIKPPESFIEWLKQRKERRKLQSINNKN